MTNAPNIADLVKGSREWALSWGSVEHPLCTLLIQLADALEEMNGLLSLCNVDEIVSQRDAARAELAELKSESRTIIHEACRERDAALAELDQLRIRLNGPAWDKFVSMLETSATKIEEK